MSLRPFPIALAALLAAGACSNANDDVHPAPPTDAGADASGPCETTTPTSDAGFALQPFCAPADPGGGGVLFTVSGEVLALTGYPFPPAQSSDPAFVDGWDVKFSRLLTTIDKIALSANPDEVPGDPSRTGGVVAEVDGPWAVDLSHSDPTYLPGKGSPGEEAVPIAALSRQSNGDRFAADGTRYAFGFDVIAATRNAKNVNLDALALADYERMIADGCSTLYVGTATFKGDKTTPGCYPPGYENWPEVVSFRLCFRTPTTYANCQNPDNDPAEPFANEEHQRGIALKTNASVIAQVTMHTDHPFWDSVLHGAPAHFDQFAARVVGAGADAGITPTVTLEMTNGVDYTAISDAAGKKLNWRYCMEPPTDVHPKFTGPMAFDPETVPHAIGGNAASGLRDYADFSGYVQSTQGHLNGDGLCFVKRDYPSPR